MSAEILTNQQREALLAPTIFHENWWLDLATGGRACVAEVVENGQLVARLPYVTAGAGRLTRRIVMPMATHFLGPAVDEGAGSAHTRLTRRIELTRELIGKLPPALSVTMKCHAGVQDTIAFQMEGFHTGVQYTYEIAPQDIESVWQAMHKKRRWTIRDAQKSCTVARLDDAQAFMRFYDKNLERTGKASILNSLQCTRLIEETLRRGRGAIYTASCAGVLTAAVFCVFDARASYYLLATRDPAGHSGAVSLLAFEAIKEAMARGLTFDFYGLCEAGGVVFFTTFGGVVRPRYIVTRETGAMRLYRALRAALGKDNTYA